MVKLSHKFSLGLIWQAFPLTKGKQRASKTSIYVWAKRDLGVLQE